jgi:2-keto-4-pentenoate hydratase
MMTIAEEAASLLRAARRDPARALPALADALRPADAAAAYAVQQAAAAGIAIGGWKVGAAGPDKPCLCAPMPEAGLHASPARLPAGRLRGVEAEVAFRLGRDLPARPAPYTREEVIAALATAHPAIEVLETAFRDPETVDPLSLLADSLAHGGFVYGSGVAAWQTLDFATMTVTQAINGATVTGTGNPAGDMIRLIVWLANEGSRWAGGLRAGQFVTCGSWTGKTLAPPGAHLHVVFAGLGEAAAEFAA